MEFDNLARNAAQLSAQLSDLEKQNKELSAKTDSTVKALDEAAKENKKVREDVDTVRLKNEIEELKRRIKNTEADRDKALTDLAKVAKQREILIRDSAILHYNLGAIFFKGRDYVRAAEEFKKSLELNPLLAEAYYNLGIIYDDYLGDGAAAILHYKKYLELSPKAVDADRVLEKAVQAQLREKTRVDSPLDKDFSIHH
jgi:tetratricopeptide (TPR) repeat protein